MLSHNNSMSLNSLTSALNEIKPDKEQQFGFNDFKYELDKIEYNNKTKYESVMRFKEWADSVSHHTFPKTKYAWINTICAQPNLRNIFVSYKTRDIITNIYLKEHVNIYILNYYRNTYNEHKLDELTRHDNKSILCKLNANQIFDNLIEFGVISVNGRRVNINRYKLETAIFSNKSKRLRLEYDDGNDADLECDDTDLEGESGYKRMRI